MKRSAAHAQETPGVPTLTRPVSVKQTSGEGNSGLIALLERVSSKSVRYILDCIGPFQSLFMAANLTLLDILVEAEIGKNNKKKFPPRQGRKPALTIVVKATQERVKSRVKDLLLQNFYETTCLIVRHFRYPASRIAPAKHFPLR
jgi:hypothetical protein